MNIKIIPLEEKYLEETIVMLNKIFPVQDEEENADTCFRANLDYEKYRDILKKWKIPKLEYFLAIDVKRDRVVGTSGIYEMDDDSKSAWIGWTAVSSEYRRKGIGRKLVSFVLKEAKKEAIKR